MTVMRTFEGELPDGVKLYKSYSNIGKRLRQIETGRIYDVAVDVEEALYTYEETDIDRRMD